MSQPAIIVENLSKRYRIGVEEKPAQSARQVLRSLVSSPFRYLSRMMRPPTEEETLWALKDVSFEVKKGEVVGIIGRNGAGKSTLLKILSRITEPTEGRVEMYGRVGSLLEVGTGFHSELTGRENIYLSGAILGMKKAEIDRKFDEIVAFAGVEKFIDTPVKRYSSGMYVRLAFAVAAHLETEILLVDEVLAVGDAEFQKKCLGKMGDVAKEGRTVLFVSHNMAAVLNMCKRAILLQAGRVVQNGVSSVVVDKYLESLSTIAVIPLANRLDREGNQRLKFLAAYLLNKKGKAITAAVLGQPIIIALQYESLGNRQLTNVRVDIGVHGRFDENLFHLSTRTLGQDLKEIPTRGVLFCYIQRVPLQPGRYSFNLFATVEGEIADWIKGAGVIEVCASDVFGSGRLPPVEQGSFLVEHHWEVAQEDELGRNQWQ